MDALTRLSGDARTFVDKVWARQPHIHQAAADEFDDLFSVADADHLITGTSLRIPQLRVALHGDVLPQSRYTRSAAIGGVSMTGLVDARKLFRLFDDGATIVFQGLHRYWRPLTELIRALEAELGHPCQANAYLTPPGSQGFALHSDTHDVFVFQTYGEKEWEIHDDGEARQVRMAPGTSMYLPTGTPHAARTQAGASLHVTVGINRLTWRDLVTAAIDPLLASAELAEPLPAGFLHDPEVVARTLQTYLDDVASQLSEVDPSATLASHRERFLSKRQPTLHGGLIDRLSLGELADTTLVRRRRASTLELVPRAEKLRVLLGDRVLQMPAWLEPPLRHLQGVAELRPADLADWLDQESRLVLVRRLVREGLLEVVR